MALLLLDSNEPEGAQRYIEAAQKGPLYVEEKKLLDEALAKMSVPQPTPEPAPVQPPAPSPSSAPAPSGPPPDQPRPN